MLTHQFISEVSLLGMAFDAIGGLYLAYDLLGGKSGPLRTVTRISSYAALFFFGYAIVLGLRYAVIAAVGMGILLAVEYRLIDRNAGHERPNRIPVLLFGMWRGIVIGVAAMTFAGVASALCLAC